MRPGISILITARSGHDTRSRVAPPQGTGVRIAEVPERVAERPSAACEACARHSVPQDPQALRVALSHVAPAVDPAAGGEERFAAAEDGTAR